MDTEPATGSTEDMMAGHKHSAIPDGCPDGKQHNNRAIMAPNEIPTTTETSRQTTETE